jgi:type III restriction enzyme
MELKKYQQDVIEDLISYLHEYEHTKKPKHAYRLHWNKKGVIVGAGKLPDYQNVVKRVPHVCLKVPTAGGKTYIACNSLHYIFESSLLSTKNLVIWLVPSKAILTQTLRNLRDVDHPYRKRLNAHFAGKVEIFSKEEALQGAGFNPDSFESQLNILVLSFDSFRASNKEGRKVYQENANLASFPQSFGVESVDLNADETSLVRVLASMSPVIIVDESHNCDLC